MSQNAIIVAVSNTHKHMYTPPTPPPKTTRTTPRPLQPPKSARTAPPFEKGSKQKEDEKKKGKERKNRGNTEKAKTGVSLAPPMKGTFATYASGSSFFFFFFFSLSLLSSIVDGDVCPPFYPYRHSEKKKNEYREKRRKKKKARSKSTKCFEGHNNIYNDPDGSRRLTGTLP